MVPTADNPLDALSGIQAPLLFQGLPHVLDGYSWIFVTAGFLILVAGHNWRMYEAGNDGHSITRAWYRTLLILTFMMLSPKLCQLAYEGVDNIVAASGLGTPTGVTRKCIKLAMSTPELESVFSGFSKNASQPKQGTPASVQKAIEQGGLWSYAKAFWFTLGDEASGLKHGAKKAFEVLTDGPAMVAAMVTSLVKAVAIFLSSVFMFLFLLFAGMIAYAMDTIRYFLLILGALLLPTFIAGYNTRSFCNHGHKYVTTLISLMLWPIWWMFGHIGTVGLFNAYVSLLSGTSVVASAANSNFATSYNWQNIDSTVSGSTLASVAGGGLMAAGASVSFLYLGLVVLGALGLFTWVLLVTVGGPVLGHKLVTTSASFYGDASVRNSMASSRETGVARVEVDAKTETANSTRASALDSGNPGGLAAGEISRAAASVSGRTLGSSVQPRMTAQLEVDGSPASMIQAAKTATHSLREGYDLRASSGWNAETGSFPTDLAGAQDYLSRVRKAGLRPAEPIE